MGAVAEPPAPTKGSVLQPKWQTARDPEPAEEEEILDAPEETVSAQIASLGMEEPQRVQKEWPHVLQAIAKIKPTLKSYLVQGEIKEVQGGKVVIGFDEQYSFHRDALDTEQNKELVEAQLELRIGKRLRVRFVQTETSADQPAEKKPTLRVSKEKQTDIPPVTFAISAFAN